MSSQELIATAKAMVAEGKGLLAMDESPRTCSKRFEKVGIPQTVVNKKAEIVRFYLPPDANCLLSVMDHCLRSRHYVNVVIAGKHTRRRSG